MPSEDGLFEICYHALKLEVIISEEKGTIIKFSKIA